MVVAGLIFLPLIVAGELTKLGVPESLVYFPAFIASVGVGLYMMWWILKNMD